MSGGPTTSPRTKKESQLPRSWSLEPLFSEGTDGVVNPEVQRFLVANSNLRLTKQIATGSGGTLIYLAQREGEGSPQFKPTGSAKFSPFKSLRKKKIPLSLCAVKVIPICKTAEKMDCVSEVQTESEIKKEIFVMNQLKGREHILELEEHYASDNFYILVSPYLSGGDLFEFVQCKIKERRAKQLQRGTGGTIRSPVGALTEKLAKKIMFQILLGVEVMHTSGYIHRDLKPENILLSKSISVFLSDFGCATTYGNGKKHKIIGSFQYSSPEIVTSSEYVGPEVDMWSCGVLLYSIMVGSFPFEGKTNNETKQNIISGQWRVLPFFSKNLVDLLSQFFETDPTKRITVSDALLHPWFARLNSCRVAEDSDACVEVDESLEDGSVGRDGPVGGVGDGARRKKRKPRNKNSFLKKKQKKNKKAKSSNSVHN